MLAEIYGWFTEGFDTGDVKEATMLLEKLSFRLVCACVALGRSGPS